jgi:NAD(P)-dependent dehydrogenase (short-subunit alcohol dehydrogenase family)
MDTVLITGASRGIGRATALLAAARGWPVAINYRNDAQAAAVTAAEVRKRGGRATTIQGDVSVEADVVALFAQAQADLGPLGGVVINAGVTAPAMPLAQMSAQRMRRVFEVNVGIRIGPASWAAPARSAGPARRRRWRRGSSGC